MEQNLQQVAQYLETKSIGAIAIADINNIDTIQSAVALYLGLTKLGKQVSLVSPRPVSSSITPFASKFVQTISGEGNNLVLSFPYEEGSIDKVDYAIQGNIFNLIIVPRPGHARINFEDVRYTYSGGSIEFLITLDVLTLEQLSAVYRQDAQNVKDADIVAFARREGFSNFGTINVYNSQVASTAEMVLALTNTLGIEIDKEIATALFQALTWGTRNFTTFQVSPQTFEHAAQLLSLGASRQREQMRLQERPQQPQRPQPRSNQTPMRDRPVQHSQPQPRPHQEQRQNSGQGGQKPFSHLREQIKQELRELQNHQGEGNPPAPAPQPQEEPQEDTTPSLKPKIFSSSE